MSIGGMAPQKVSDMLSTKGVRPRQLPLGRPGGKWFKSDTDHKALQTLFAGGLAGAFAKTCVAPLERIKLLCQVAGMKQGHSSGFTANMMDIARKDGITGFWRGNAANVVRIIPNKGLLFLCNDKFKESLLKPGQSARDLEPWQRVAAGSMAGVATVTTSYPLDFIRTRLAGQDGGKKMYKGIVDCALQTVRRDGVTGLYRGLAPTVAGIIPYAGINFAAYEMLKKRVPTNEDGTTDAFWKLSCGALAGFISQSVSFPIDTVRRRMQLQGSPDLPKLYTGSWHCFRSILAKEGMLGLFRGFIANMARTGPNVAIQFAAYDALHSYFEKLDEKY